MDVQADRERDELLPRLGQLYGWLARAVEITDLERNALAHSHTILAANWPRMLPLERAEAFDMVTGEFCEALARGSVKVTTVDSTNVSREIGYIDSMALSRSDDRDRAFGEVRDRVQQIKALYETSGSSANEWADLFLSFKGMTSSKLQRVNQVTLEALVRVMDGVFEDARSAPVRVGRLAPAERLPSADTVLFHAQCVTQVANRRYRVFVLLLRSLRSLYSVQLPENSTPMELKASEFEHIRGIVEFVSSDAARADFEGLVTKRQILDVDNARTLVFAACETLARRHVLPSSVPLGYSLTVSLRPSTPGYNRSTELESLAQARTAISARKARRYYGTSAAAWANGRQAFGRW
ncbi:hypothetical protein JCM10450v2_006519 [Rhodotorula kratochvilovae]